MNAYELAEKLENVEPYATGDDLTLSNSAAMLCQQADELNKVVQKLVKANGLIENLRIRIAELEKRIEFQGIANTVLMKTIQELNDIK